MPLVIMCGVPCSGKTLIANDLAKYLTNEKQIKTLVVISDSEKLGSGSDSYQRNELYCNAGKEKELRGYFKSAVQRHLNKETLVILDAPNYIKGYRYELYCLSKEHKTTHCVVECICPTEAAWTWNENRQTPSDGEDGKENHEKYSRQVFDALVQRYEAPDSRNRWDSPLIAIQTDRDDDDGERNAQYEKVFNALYNRDAPPPNLSTQSQPLSSTNFLYELDCKTQEVVKQITASQQLGLSNDITIPNASTKVHLQRPYTVAELNRLRRQFITYTKMHPVADPLQIINTFVQYINSSCSSN